MELSGAEILIQSFMNHNVDAIFGYPGACVISILDHLYDNKEIRQILVRHEQGAVHAATGYARLSNKPGIVVVTSGPGATNTITGITDAFFSGVPLIVISGQVSSNLIGTDAFQEADMVNITASITKWNYQIREADEIASVVDKAFDIATSGKQGPVLLDITKDAQTGRAQYLSDSKAVVKSLYQEIIDALKNSQKEIVLVVDMVTNDFYTEEYFGYNRVLKSDIFCVAGFGLPAAIGATFATQNKTICLVVGTLEFQATIKELGVVKQLGVDIKIIVLNYNCEIESPDFIKIASAYGIKAKSINAISDDLRDSIVKMVNSTESYILELRYSAI